MSKIKHSNIPIFLPELSCPHQCVFCNQVKISGKDDIPAPSEISSIIEKHLSTMNDGREINIAFFGGSFTGLKIERQELYLKEAYSYTKDKRVKGIRVSTRPDYINEEILDLLKKYSVTEIELGAQSTDDEVLLKSGRGHDSAAIEKACGLIKSYGINLGLQMMIGLPGDTLDKSLKTANEIVKLGAKSTRIYPALVIKDTALEKLYNNRKYRPLNMSEAVEWTKEIMKIFISNNVYILRIGLHPSEELTEQCSVVAGPIHHSFKELTVTELFHEKIMSYVKPDTINCTVSANSRFINYAVGYKGRNKNALTNRNISPEFLLDNNLRDYEIDVSCN